MAAGAAGGRREAGRPAPCLWEGSQGKRPRFPELGGKFPRRCSPGPREVGGGTAPPRGGRAEPGRAVPLPGTDRGAGASRWPPGGDLSPRPRPTSRPVPEGAAGRLQVSYAGLRVATARRSLSDPRVPSPPAGGGRDGTPAALVRGAQPAPLRRTQPPPPRRLFLFFLKKKRSMEVGFFFFSFEV